MTKHVYGDSSTVFKIKGNSDNNSEISVSFAENINMLLPLKRTTPRDGSAQGHQHGYVGPHSKIVSLGVWPLSATLKSPSLPAPMSIMIFSFFFFYTLCYAIKIMAMRYLVHCYKRFPI